MEIQWENICFALITVPVLVSAVVAVFSRNATRCAFSLFFALFGIAGYYVMLGSDFISVTQVMVYIGGILVLIIFGILLTNRTAEIDRNSATRIIISIITCAALFGAVVLQLVTNHEWGGNAKGESYSYATALDIGNALVYDYMPHFILAGIMLFLSLIASAFVVRRKE